MPKDPNDDLPPILRAMEHRSPLAAQKERRRERDAKAERRVKLWRRDLAAFAKDLDDAIVLLPWQEAQQQLRARAEAVLVARRKAAHDVRAAWFALGEAALAAQAPPPLLAFSDRTVREAAMACYWRPFLDRAAEIGLLPDDAASPAAMMAWLKPHLPKGWRFNKKLRVADARRRRRRSALT